MNLTDSPLSQTQALTDTLHDQIFDITKRHHLIFALGQIADGDQQFSLQSPTFKLKFP